MSANEIKSSRLVIAALFIGLSLVQSFKAQDQPGQTKRPSKVWAVVVGISRYPKLAGGQQLQFADRDAAGFVYSIKRAGASPDSIRLLVGPEATVAAIKTAIGNWLARSASEQDTVYLFFSGHGLVEREFGDSYLLAYDSDPKDPYSTALSLSELAHALGRRIRARQVLIIADAVRRDLFDPDADGATDATSFVKSFEQLAGSRPGVSAILASGPGEFSREGRAWGGQGVFTRYWMEAMAGSAESNADGLISGEEVYSFLSARVAEQTSNKQHPWRSGSPLAQIRLSSPQIQARNAQNEIRQEAIAKAPPREVEPPRSSDVTKPAPSIPQLADPTVRPKQQDQKGPAPTRRSAPDSSSKQPSEPKAKQPEAKTSSSVNIARSKPESKESASIKREEAPRSIPPTAEKPALKDTSPPKRDTPPATPTTEAKRPAATSETSTEIATTKTAPTPRPAPPSNVPPSVSPVSAPAAKNPTESISASVPVSKPGAVPSPLVLQIQAALSSGALIEPKNESAWDYYQRLIQDPLASTEAARLKPALADALAKSGRAIVTSDVRADNVSEKVEDFRRAGQMLTRARSLMPGNAEVAALEKLSAAQALIALQFYDEAERALAQAQSLKSAAVENAFGLLYQGKLEEFRAERAFKRAIEFEPNWAIPHYNLGLLYRSQKSDSSIAEFERATALDPKNPVFVAALGDEYFSKEQWQKAADAYRKAVSQNPTDAQLRTKLGHALYSQGLRDEANREYQKANELRNKRP